MRPSLSGFRFLRGGPLFVSDFLTVFQRKFGITAAARVLGVELGADKQNDAAQVKPQHQRDHRAKRAVGLVVIGKFAEVYPQSQRNKYPGTDRENGSRKRSPETLLDGRGQQVQQLD